MDLLRRTFILGASSLAVALPAVLGLEKPRVGALPSKLVLVHETDVPASRRFATAWPSTDARTIAFRGDVTPLIYERLVPIWRASDTSTIGLTNARAYFCLANVAADHGLRLIYRGIHDDTVPPARLVADMEQKLRDTQRLRALPVHGLLPDGANTLVSWAMVPRTTLRPQMQILLARRTI